jgi:tRNA (Thr-GGU) A37 N-methylase
MSSYTLQPVGFIRSTLKRREDAPRQGPEGAPDAWLEIEPQFAEALLGMEVGHELVVITWLHQAKRDVLKIIRAAMRAVRLPACFTRAHLRARTRSGCIR